MVQGNLVVGALVRWPSAPGAPLGVIDQVDGLRICVRFDGNDEVKVFNARAGAYRAGRAQGDGKAPEHRIDRPGAWEGDDRAATMAGHLVDRRLVTVAEADLRPHVLDDPRSRMLEGRLGKARQFALAVTARRYEIEQLTNDLVSLGESRVDIKPHQVSVVHRVITNYPHRFLLCDEVGLGKTIEAGMILKELRARGGAGRCLVIAPPNLLRQWQFELKSKFNETFSMINSDTVKFLRTTQGVTGTPLRSTTA